MITKKLKTNPNYCVYQAQLGNQLLLVTFCVFFHIITLLLSHSWTVKILHSTLLFLLFYIKLKTLSIKAIHNISATTTANFGEIA